jgi:Fe2+ transport system protein FeoA
VGGDLDFHVFMTGGEEMSVDQKISGLFGIKAKEVAGKSFPLSQAPNQKLLKVVQIRGDHDLCARVAAMGIQLGSLMKVRRIGSGSSSSCLARVSRSKHIISLCGEITEKIRVIHK